MHFVFPIFAEDVFRTTDPLIYESKNFSPLEGEPKNTFTQEISTKGMKSLYIFAKSIHFRKGDCINSLDHWHMCFCLHFLSLESMCHFSLKYYVNYHIFQINLLTMLTVSSPFL